MDSTQGTFSFDGKKKTRTRVVLRIPPLLQQVENPEDVPTWTFQKESSALVMHVKLHPNRVHLTDRMLNTRTKYAIAIKPETMCGLNWHAAQTARGNADVRKDEEKWWDDNCVIGLISPYQSGKIRIDGVPMFSAIQHSDNYRLQKLISIPPDAEANWHRCHRDVTNNAFTYNVYAAIVSHQEAESGDYKWNARSGRRRKWRRIVQLRLLDNMRLHAAQSDVIARPRYLHMSKH